MAKAEKIPAEKQKDQKSAAREWGEALVVAFVIAMIARAFIIQAYRIPSCSMEDTLLKGDHILATKYNYGLTVPFTTDKFWGADRVPERGDVIIFTFPMNHKQDFVKRVVGLPGDVVEVVDKRVFVNGREYIAGHEKHTDADILREGPRDNLPPVRVKAGHVFAMGDNRDQSYDSRFWGQVPIENIKGRALVIYFSWTTEAPWIRLGRFGHLVR